MSTEPFPKPFFRKRGVPTILVRLNLSFIVCGTACHTHVEKNTAHLCGNFFRGENTTVRRVGNAQISIHPDGAPWRRHAVSDGGVGAGKAEFQNSAVDDITRRRELSLSIPFLRRPSAFEIPFFGLSARFVLFRRPKT